MNNKGYVLIAVLVAAIVLLVLFFYPVTIDENKEEASYPVFPCQTFSSGCNAKTGDTEIEIKFPDNIVFLKHFPIEVRIAALKNAINKVTVDFQMVKMNMGLNFYQLTQSDKDKALWTGKGVLPVCTTGRTDWLAIISVQSENETKRVAFEFTINSSAQ